MRSEIIEAYGSDGVGLRVVFRWHVDRYWHAISIIAGSGAITPLLESMEGAADDVWPACPPLQSLSIEKLADGRTAALLVGMAGGSHWSASIETVIGQSELVFDIACRHQRSPQWLGSRYLQMLTLAGNWLSIESGNSRVLERNGIVEIAPEVIAPRGTSRWRFVVSAKSGSSGMGGVSRRAPPADSGASRSGLYDDTESR